LPLRASKQKGINYGFGKVSFMTKDVLPITLNGKQKLENELKNLVQVERAAVIRAIESAREMGDLSENAEYDAAKERQAWIEGRINDIQGQLAGAEVVDTSTLKNDRIVFGATVVLQDQESDEQVTYQIVGVDEANVKEGKISIISPLARSLIGKKTGDLVEVRTPNHDREYEVLKFHFA
jgi:transcription elongation factor GreA